MADLLATGSSGRRMYLFVLSADISSADSFSQRSEDRKRRWRRQYESLQDARALQNGHHNPDGDLKKEMTS